MKLSLAKMNTVLTERQLFELFNYFRYGPREENRFKISTRYNNYEFEIIYEKKYDDYVCYVTKIEEKWCDNDYSDDSLIAYLEKEN